MGFFDNIADTIRRPIAPRTPRRPPTGHPTTRRRKSGGGSFGGGQQGRVAKKRPSGGGGGGGGSYGGGGGGGYPTSSGTGSMSMAAPPAPRPPSIQDFLGGDETYQGQLAALTKALANYRSQMGERKDEYTADFTRRLGDLNLAEQRNTTDQADDYAGRGMFISGLYGKARGDLERDFNNRETDMNLAKSQFFSGLDRDFLNFSEENNLSREKAKSDAINRRALQYML